MWVRAQAENRGCAGSQARKEHSGRDSSLRSPCQKAVSPLHEQREQAGGADALGLGGTEPVLQAGVPTTRRIQPPKGDAIVVHV